MRPGSPLARVGERMDAAFAEIAALEPAFVVNTGDLILEGNAAEPEAARRWLAAYRKRADALGIPVYDTIGNNELVGTQNDAVPRDDPAFGKGLFRNAYGRTSFAFTHGDFRFVALDTHRPEDPDPHADWTFFEMDEENARFAEAELAAHADRTLVILNHEPFAGAEQWDFEPALVEANGLLERHDVAYVLSGHVHRSGSRRGRPTHISTGALSGMRWFLPESIVERGYRVVHARDGHLFAVWKRLGRPAVGFVVPEGAPDLHPVTGASLGPGDVVVAAIDAAGPFAEVELLADGRPVPLEPMDGSFFRATTPAPAASLVMRARRADGSVESARWPRETH